MTSAWVHRVCRYLAVGVAALAMAACGSSGQQSARQPAVLGPTPAVTATPDPTASPTAPACGAVQRPPIQEGGHLIGDTPPPVPYSSVPPTSGWHASGTVDIAVQPADRPMSEPRQVAVLEAGGVVVSYRALAEDERAELEGLVAQHFPRRAAVTPYERLEEGKVALTAWGVLQLCDGVDPAAITAFVAEHAAGSPASH